MKVPNRPAGSSGSEPVAAETWHALDADEAVARLESRPEGLDAAEVADRQKRFGPNILGRPAPTSPLRLIWRQINNPLIWVLIGAAAVAIAFGKYVDGSVVMAVVVLNTIIGFIQEFRASRAIEALLEMVPENATVTRDGRTQVVPASEVVPGDIVLLGAGDRVPADMRLIALRGLRIVEAALTGESLPSEKALAAVPADAPIGDRSGMVYGGTFVTSGTGTAVVAATGAATELGRISTLLREVVDLETPLTRALGQLGRLITVATLAAAAVMIGVGVWRATAAGAAMEVAIGESVVFAIALAVGAIPEGLPAIVTIALAIGVQRMASRRVIIRNLPAVETLGATTVICSDKTGTLTRNEMTVQELWTPRGVTALSGVGYEPVGSFSRDGTVLAKAPDDIRSLLLDAALCSDASLTRQGGAWAIVGDPTEGALVVAAEKAGVAVDAARAEFLRIDAIPFDSANQFMATLHRAPDGSRRLILKGAPEVILRRCAVDQAGSEIDEAQFHEDVERLAAHGMRVLALADRDYHDPEGGELDEAHVAGGFRLAGLIGMIDPPREEAIAAIRSCATAGIDVKMITGDHRVTAEAIAAQLGLTGTGASLTGAELAELDDDELRPVARDRSVFARVAPEQKLRLVRALQAEGHVVAMTGDGVNDAPALRQSNVGVAMGITGTAVSQQAADIVLTDDNFASIEAAVEEGRRVYDNLIKSLAFVLPTNLGLAFILIVAVALFPFDVVTGDLLLPLLPTQILWINLVATVALALPLAFEAMEPDVMARPPRDPVAPVLSGFVIQRTFVVATLMAMGAIGLFLWQYQRAVGAGQAEGAAISTAQTMAVTTVILFQVFYLLNCRSLRDSIFRIGLFSNPKVFIGLGALFVLQAVFIYAPPMNAIFGTRPLGIDELAVAALVGAIILPVISAEKWIQARRARNGASRRVLPET
ncbi:MAG TPA: HAD-IC family P-type ATPase [Patescibacteria group bacterium]|nr:HAD-IC family P-type ATPase [Patescibacteria group bacterium]